MAATPSSENVQLHTRASNCTLLTPGRELCRTGLSVRIPRVPPYTYRRVSPQDADDLTRRPGRPSATQGLALALTVVSDARPAAATPSSKDVQLHTRASNCTP